MQTKMIAKDSPLRLTNGPIPNLRVVAELVCACVWMGGGGVLLQVRGVRGELSTFKVFLRLPIHDQITTELAPLGLVTRPYLFFHNGERTRLGSLAQVIHEVFGGQKS